MIIYYGVKKRSIPDYLFSRSHAPAWERSSVGIPTPERGNETNQLEQFSIEVVEKTHLLFKTLNKQVGWVSELAMTKTSYAYQIG